MVEAILRACGSTQITGGFTKRRKTQEGPVIITLDIETFPIVAYCWNIWDENIGLEQIIEDWSIASFAYKELGTRKVYFFGTGGRGADKVRDDSEVLKELWKVLDRADIVITQNGRAFDEKKINARLVQKGFPPYKPVKVIDTKLIAKKHFAFTSNKLEWLSKILTDLPKHKHKEFPGFELWLECLKDNPKAWKVMRKYNIIDVISDEKVYLAVRGWMEGHPNVATYTEDVRPACPKCGSVRVEKNGIRTTQTGAYHRYRCRDCGGHARSRYTLNSLAKRKALLSN